MNSKINFVDNQSEIFTIVDDDETQDQQNISTTTTTASEVSRRKSTSATTIDQLIISPSSKSVAIKKADKIAQKRRKTFHKLLNCDDEITFESVIPDDNKFVKKVKKLPQKTKSDKGIDEKSTEIKIPKQCVTTTPKAPYYLNIENPNKEFIQRVAFLRSCVKYMLQSAGKEPIDFKYGDNSLSKLLNNYVSVAPTEPEEIVLSD